MSPPADSKGGMGMNMVTTVMAFSVSAFFVLFVFVRLLCARLHLRTANHAAAHAGDAFVLQTYNVERGIRGLESFPTVKLDDSEKRPPGQEESQCTVCLEEYAAKDVVRVLPACGHAFHAACIDAWLRQHPTCPVCRASLKATAKKHHHRAAPLEHSLAIAAVARDPEESRSHHVPASSSSGVTASPPHQPEAAEETGMGSGQRLEIVVEEPGSAEDRQQGVVDRSDSGCGAGETARQIVPAS